MTTRQFLFGMLGLALTWLLLWLFFLGPGTVFLRT